ncbi:MAG: quinone oxidoreductase [Actinomycetota bacterium]|nr:quinone oxidoreductase [Actinomycetota bacterium]
MKAIVVTETGGAEKLVLGEVPDPSPGEGEILVDVIAAGINYIDTYHRGGLYPLDLPMTPGVEGAGTVTEVGPGVDGVSVGDQVAWTWVMGSYAEQIVLPAASTVPIPEGVDPAIAAAVFLQGATAHYLAIDTFPLSEGDRCLIHAGAGGVGLLLTQVAKMRGAEVITTVGTADKAELSRQAGADHVVIYTETSFKDDIEAKYGPTPIDVVYDGVGAATFDDGLDLLRPRGVMVTFGNASGPVPPISPLVLSQKGSLFLTRPTLGNHIATREELLSRTDDLFSWILEGKLHVRIGAEFALAEAAEAHRALEHRQTTGKVLLRP